MNFHQSKRSCIAGITCLKGFPSFGINQSQGQGRLACMGKTDQVLAACRLPRAVDDTLHDDGGKAEALIASVTR